MRFKLPIASTAVSLVCLFASFSNAQNVTQALAGPAGDQFRILVTSMPQTGEDVMKIQSFNVLIDSFKQGEQPSYYLVEIVSNIRNLDTDEKKQKTLLLRWGREGEVEAQCAQDWVKSSGAEIDKIVDASKALVQLAPVAAGQAVQLELPKELGQKLSAIMNGLENSKLQCIQASGPEKL